MYEQTKATASEETLDHPSAEETAAEALPQRDASEECSDGVVEEASSVDQETAPASDPDAGSSPLPSASEDPLGELESLRQELKSLRAEMTQRQAVMDRIGRECLELEELYPNTNLNSLPDDVWESVRRGTPIAAAYALSLRRRERTEELARVRNEENRARSTGSLEAPRPGYFSPEEVRSMSAEEVRRNYSSILLSMQKWR